VLGSPPRHSFYEPVETVLCYGFIIPDGRVDNIVAALYRELVDDRPGPVTNGLATLYIAEVLRDSCRDAAFRAVRRSREQPTKTMLCIGTSLRPFSLQDDAIAAIADKLRMQPSDAEWAFSNQMRSHFPDYESEEEGSTDEESTEESTEESMEEPLTDHDDEELANNSIAHVREWTDRVSDSCK
jgi:hypothetical protein